MAGIGVELRKLTCRDDLIGIARAYGHSSIASSGPWVFTILALGGIAFWGPGFTSTEELAVFRLIIIYNFAFSLVLSAPVTIIATRFLADGLYRGDVREAPGMLMGTLAVLYATQLVFVVPFYMFYVNLTPAARLGALFNFFLVTGIWNVSVFLTALKDYHAVSRSFAIGMIVALGASLAAARTHSVAAMLFGFDAGLTVIMFSLATRIFAEYPYRLASPFGFLHYYRKYAEVALSGFLYNAAIWIDKWVMWFSPEAESLPSRMISCPEYDGATFLAYLTIVPSMAMFVISVETRFFESYRRFYQDILHHANYAKIAVNHKSLIRELLASARNVVVLQGSVSYSIILLAPSIFEALRLNFLQLAMFRLAVLGALFHVLLLFTFILLSYFDMRRAALKVNALFLVTNGLFTWGGLKLGFPYYGYGYFLAAFLSGLVAFLVLAHHVRDLPYQTFVKNNAAIK